MKTLIQNLTILVLLVCTVAVYPQGQNINEGSNDYDRSLKGLTIQEIRNAVYGVPTYFGREMLKHDIPVMRSLVEIKTPAVTPALYIDSLIYENILDAPLLDFPELLLKRFPFLIMHRLDATERIMEVMDSLALKKPNITKEEYWEILKRDYAQVVRRNFRIMYDTKLYKLYPYRKIGDIRHFREIFIASSYLPLQNNIPIEAKPYLERLGALPPDSLYFTKVKRRLIITH